MVLASRIGLISSRTVVDIPTGIDSHDAVDMLSATARRSARRLTSHRRARRGATCGEADREGEWENALLTHV